MPLLRNSRRYRDGRRGRIAFSVIVALVGLLFVSFPFWLVKDPPTGGVFAAVGGALLAFSVAALLQELQDPVLQAVEEALSRSVDPASEGDLTAVVRDEVRRAVSAAVAADVAFGPRAALRGRLALEDAERLIRIQGISLSQKWEMVNLLEEAFRRRPDLRVRICLMHPFSAMAAARERDLGFPAGHLRDIIAETVDQLSALRSRLADPSRLEVRGSEAIPYYGLSIRDEDRAVLSLAREGRGGDQNAGVYLEAVNEDVRRALDDLIEGFDARWAASRDLLEATAAVLLPESVEQEDGVVRFAVRAGGPVAVDRSRVTADAGRVELAVDPDRPDLLLVTARPAVPAVPHRFRIEQLETEAGAWLHVGVPVDVPREASVPE